MLLIPCPWCGKRAETEFRCAGQVKVARTELLEADDEAWLEYLYQTDNQRGVLTEYWCHEKGCGEWFTLRRDTTTHELVDRDPEP